MRWLKPKTLIRNEHEGKLSEAFYRGLYKVFSKVRYETLHLRLLSCHTKIDPAMVMPSDFGSIQ
jgi:hypothetical protein